MVAKKKKIQVLNPIMKIMKCPRCNAETRHTLVEKDDEVKYRCNLCMRLH